MKETEFLSNMSHELRTPLNAIIGFSEMLLAGDYTKYKQQEYLKNISLSGKHMLDLLNDILDMSRIESGNMQLNHQIFDSKQAIKETINILNSIACKKNITITSKLEKTIIEADLRKFKQIMFNLIINAIKYTPENGNVEIKSKTENNYIKIEVQDTGVGIKSCDHDKIFEKFKRLNSTYTKRQEGSGLGLALTKQLIECHGGQINFISEENKGTKFWFNIPLNRIEQPKSLIYKVNELYT